MLMNRHEDDTLGELDYAKFDKYLNEKIFIIHDICNSKKTFRAQFHEFYNFMKQGFERPEVRKHPLQYKFTRDNSEQVKTMEIRHMIVHLSLWYAFIRYKKVEEINSSQLIDCYNITADSLYDYINEHLISPYAATIDSKVISKALDDVIYLLSLIYIDFVLMMGLTIDIETWIRLREKFPRFKELINTKPEPGMQPYEIEEMLDERLKEYLDIVINQDKENNIRPFLVSGVGINKGQLSQLSIMGGLKPDIEGNVNPVPIDSNYVNGGLNSVTNFYIDAQAGCKPLILNKTVMGKSGYFAYKTMTLASNFRLSDVDDCHTKRLVEFEVKTKKHLKKIDKRYYRFPDEDKSVLHVVHAKKDQFLIGKTILLRSPSTCACQDGICHICYGDLYYTNRDKHFHAGRFAATQINEPVQQKILSSKHMLKTVSEKINFNDRFDDFFVLDTNKICLNLDSNMNLSDWKMYIEDDDLFIVDELAPKDEDYNIYIEKFKLINKHTGECIDFVEEKERGIYLFGSVAAVLHKDKHLEGESVVLGNLDDNLPIGIINIVNNELTTPLKNIIKLLDRKDHFGCDTIDDMENKMVQLVIDSGMSADAVHCSMIIKGLIRAEDNILVQPDFRDPEECEHYQLLTVSKALVFNPSFTVSFSFDNANKQIVSPTTYEKYRPSDYDINYREDIYEDSVKYYSELEERKRIERQKHRDKKMWKKLYGNRMQVNLED